jgi:beta-glucosidase
LVRPEKELKGFAKIELQPGETKTVSIALDFRSFAYYHPGYQQWITEDGEFDLLVGASSTDIRNSLTVTLQSTLNLPCILDRESTIREWLEDPRGKTVFEPMFQQMAAQMISILGSDCNELAAGMDLLGFLMDMPLPGVLHFQESALPMPADDLVDGLLAQAHAL